MANKHSAHLGMPVMCREGMLRRESPNAPVLAELHCVDCCDSFRNCEDSNEDLVLLRLKNIQALLFDLFKFIFHLYDDLLDLGVVGF